mmetsp:Transcript_29750/g.49088  ORF Transcript_29750/g.49088 Transcript_29750/m.49088 type:complete len:325 (+) Transcript_29750:459-1433(+)
MRTLYEGLNRYSDGYSCSEEIKVLEKELMDYYDDSDMTETQMLGVTFVDFSTNQINNESYEAACKAVGGQYVELHYTAQCDSITQGRSKFATIIVAGHPRCYAGSCNVEADSHPLFRRFTLQATEDRDSRNRQGNTVCFGYLLDEEFGSLCDYSTSSTVDGTIAIQVARNSLEPAVTTEKWLGIIPLDTLIVEFPGSENEFEETCKAVEKSNIYATVSSDITCSDGKNYRKEFDVSDFPVCLSAGCAKGGSIMSGETVHYESTAEIEEATLDTMMKSFHDNMIFLELLDDPTNNVVCVASDATSVVMRTGIAVVAALVAGLSYF